MSGMFGPLLVGLLFILVPVLVLIGVIAFLRKNKTGMRRITSIPAGWRATKARVTGGNVEEAIRTRVEDDPFYYPMVAFEYTVEGRAYTGSQGVERPYNYAGRAKKTLAQYPIGSEIVVYYNPERPADARLPKK